MNSRLGWLEFRASGFRGLIRTVGFNFKGLGFRGFGFGSLRV